MTNQRFVPLPAILFDYSLSDSELQDRWVSAAERKCESLRAWRAELLSELAEAEKALAEAEAFMVEAKQKQREYHQREWQRAPVPSQVQALLRRRSPAEVAALLEEASEQGTEIVPSYKKGRIERQDELDAILEETNRPVLPKARDY